MGRVTTRQLLPRNTRPIGFDPKECLLINSLLSTSVILPRLRQYSSGGLVFGSKGDLAWSAAWGDTDGWHMSGTVQHNQYTGHSVMDVLHVYFETRSSQAQTPTSGVGKPCIASQRPGTPVAKQQFFNSVSPSKCRETPGIVQPTPIGQNGRWTAASLRRGELREKDVARLLG